MMGVNKMRGRLFAMAAVVGSAMFSASVANADTIAGWTFEGDAVATNNTPAADIGSGTATSIGMNIYPTPNVGITQDDVLVGKSSDTGANALGDTTQEWRVRGQAGTNGAANGWSSAAPIGTQGAAFSASTVGYTQINVSFDWYTTTQGEANLQLEYTNNGGTSWTNVPITVPAADTGLVVSNNTLSPNTVNGSYVSDNLLTNGSKAGQDWFQGLTAQINDPAAANNANFEIEMVNASTGADDVSTQGTALNNSSGNWRFDNVYIDGTASAPEPTSFVTLGFAAMGLFGCRRSKR